MLQVQITDEQMENMSEKAKEELVSQLSTYAERIIKEANLIEEAIVKMEQIEKLQAV